MAYEFYSAQTRQVKTAMVLSSATLFLYTLIGRPVEAEGYIKIPPGQYEIPSAFLIYLFFGSAIYFTASFFVSARYDQRMEEFPKLAKELRNVLAKLDGYRNSLNGLHKYSASEVTEQFNKIYDEAKEFDCESMKGAADQIQGTQKILIKDAANFINDLSRQTTYEQVYNEYKNSLSIMKADADSFFKDLPNKLEGFEKKTEGMARFHNHF